MVLNGNFEPQTLGAGLVANVGERYSKLFALNSPFIDLFDVARKYSCFHIGTTSSE